MNKIMKLEDCLELIIDYRGKTPKKLGGDWSEKGKYRGLSAKNIKNMKIVNEDSIRKVNTDIYKKWMLKEIQKEDVLLTSEAPLGESYFWDSEEKIVLSQRLFALRVDKNILYPRYFYYFVNSSFFQKELLNKASGSTVFGIRQEQLLKTNIIVPDLQTQKEIGDSIYKVSKKVEINNELISNLEEYIQLLFTKWFVQFNFPDENGNPYKDSGGEMQEIDGEIIPVSWNFDLLSSLGKVISGGTPSTSNKSYFCDSGIPWLTPKDLSMTTNKYIRGGATDITEEGLKNSSAKLMPSGTVLMSSRAPIGYLGISKNEITTNQGFKSIVPDLDVGSEYIYYTLKRLMPKIERVGSGSTFKEVSKEMLSGLKIVKPEISILQKFQETVEPLSDKIILLEEENEKLIELRGLMIKKYIK
jgi:type I restriction enzyme, S subunit